MLIDRTWKLKYTPEDGDLVRVFYVPALEDAARYDRLTGYFDAGALALAARGVDGLVRNDGRMRLVVGCTLRAPEIDAIDKGAALRDLVERRLVELPLAPPDADAAHALELLAWMIGRGHLDVKVAVPCHEGRPVSDTAIFHEKSGVVEDRAGYKVAWTGSLNETAAGWQRNWESINVYRSWGPEPERVAGEERNFARLWANRSPRAIVLDVPDAARQDLLRFLPPDLPARLKAKPPPQTRPTPATGQSRPTSATGQIRPTRPRSRRPTAGGSSGPSSGKRRRCPAAGARVGEATAHRRALAAPAPGLRSSLRAMAAEAPDRGRGRSRQDHPGGAAAAPGVARGPGEAHSHPRAEGGPEAVADRAARAVQPRLAHLRRAQAQPLPVPRPARAPRARGRPGPLARRARRHRVEPPHAPEGPRRRAARRRAVGPDRPRRGPPRPPARRRQPARGRPEHAARADAGPQDPHPGPRAADGDADAGASHRGVGPARSPRAAPGMDGAGVPPLLRAGRPAESLPGGVRPHGAALPGRRARPRGGVARRRPAPDRTLAPEGRDGAARPARRGEHSPPPARDPRALRRPSPSCAPTRRFGASSRGTPASCCADTPRPACCRPPSRTGASRTASST